MQNLLKIALYLQSKQVQLSSMDKRWWLFESGKTPGRLLKVYWLQALLVGHHLNCCSPQYHLGTYCMREPIK